MTLTASIQQWSPAINWTSKAAGSVGVRLSEAFSSFALAVNANPGNSSVPLSIIKDHQAATGTTTYGHLWRLGHPVNPVILSFINSSKVQTFNASSSSALLRLGLESAFTNDSSNGGYGTFATTLATLNAGLSYYAPDGSPVIDQAGLLLVLMNTTPDAEFFCYTYATTNGDTYAQNHTLLLFRSPVSSGWNVALIRSNALAGMFHSQNFFIWNNNTLVAANPFPLPPSGTEQQLINGVGLLPQVFGPTGLFAHGTIQNRLPLPAPFWFGSNQISDPRRLGRVSNPGGSGTFYQLAAAASGALDTWVLVPSGTAAMEGWSSIGSVSWSTMPDRLSFCPLLTPAPVAMGPATGPDFLIDWSSAALGAPGVRQHPFYAKQLQGGGAGGGSSSRPSTGVLWPRRL